MRLRALRCLVLAPVALAWPASAAAQGAGAVRGTVRAASGSPIAGAEVRIADSVRATSTEDGRFVVGDLPAGILRISVRAVGFTPYNANMRLSEGDTAGVDVILRPTDATRLPEVEVTETSVSSIPEFEERRREGFGTFVTRAQLDSFGGAPLTDVLRRKANRIQYVRHCLGGFALASHQQSMSIMAMAPPGAGGYKNCNMPRACYFQVFLDGVMLYNPTAGGLPPKVDEFRALNLEGVEVYRGGAQTPSRYSGSSAACGTVLLWTRRAPP